MVLVVGAKKLLSLPSDWSNKCLPAVEALINDGLILQGLMLSDLIDDVVLEWLQEISHGD